MIRSEHCIVTYDFVKREVTPDRLLRGRDAVYLKATQQCLELYRRGVGRVRQELHGEVEDCLGAIAGCPPRRIAAFCKLLDDASEYSRSSGKAAFRKRVFELSSPLHPVVQQREGIFENDLQAVRQRIADELKLTWEEIEDRLYDDVIELQKLKQFPETLSPETLLARYNLAQTQAALYRATRVRIDAYAQASYVVRQAKLAGLMHRINRCTRTEGEPREGYRIILDGPASSLRETTRYGIGYAKLLPALLACSDWLLIADILGPQNRSFFLKLSPADRLTSEATAPAPFDSELEQQVAERWQKTPVTDWQLARDAEFLVKHQEIFTPDFTLTHRDGRKIYIEVVGYWTPEYLQEKAQRLARFAITESDSVRWLLMLDRPPNAAKMDLLQSLKLPTVVISKTNGPEQWIRTVFALP
jgi:predicted nuclease of restriction endonuclease-like RecB superfamily